VVWPRVCSGRAQIHPDWTISCGTKMDLIQEIESWVRMNSARCERHLIKLGYRCPEGQHGLCTARPRIAGGGGCAGQRAGNGNGQRERGRLRHRATLPKRAPRAPAAVWRWKLTQVFDFVLMYALMPAFSPSACSFPPCKVYTHTHTHTDEEV